MELAINGDSLHINLNWKEKLAAISGSLTIPLTHITSVDLDYPRIPNGIRLPGSYLPGLVAAGTYYTRKGKEFWCVIKKKNILRIELKDEFYSRLILGLDNNKSWKETLDSTFPA
ncbi:MAG: hypothetical protein JRZ94_05690 [Nitrososphaerota archaeon]|nr:hypothetical protein [Nitrososphaerota archaeon]